ncbi:MAG: hypothetical protein JSR09_09225 [Bacteroidetes bacterium]|nr:hypothetical protein [Bacteroidota bacterium]MBS1649871.1 hypothetical protein [Bacteroidota bacterium]
MKLTVLFTAFILLSNLVKAQDYDHSYKYKKIVRIGFSLEPKVSLHTKLITDIAHYYETEKILIDSTNAKSLRDTLYAKNKAFYAFFKAKHDTANVFDRLFNNVCIFLSLAFNRTLAPHEINYDDTLFIFKIVNTSQPEQQGVFKKDSLDYLISIENFTSVQQTSYYNILFNLSIQSKKDKALQVIKMNVPFTDQQKEYNMFFSCDKPFECLIANVTELTVKVIAERLYKDGFRK